jgi:hypothetical protein
VGIFFERQDALTPDHPAVKRVKRVVQAPAVADDAEATATATQVAEEVQTAKGPMKINLNAFTAAATVFLVLLVAAVVTASQADAQTAADTLMKDLARLIQTLLTGWSGAVLGLIGGEAVGAKS